MNAFRATGAAVAILLAGFALSCAQPETQSAAGSAPVGQGAVQREHLIVETQTGPVAFEVEIADDDDERERGLMFRREMAPDHGMLFDFSPPQPLSFWMRNTHLSLDIIFIGADGRILNIAERTTPYSDAAIPSRGPARGVLEINAGLARSHGIAPGDRVRHRIFPD